MSFKRPESALVVMYTEQGKVLVMQREDDADFWQSVTGSLEDGEQAIDTAYREVAEETGIDCRERGLTIMDCRHVNQYRIRSRWQHRYPPGISINTEYVFALCLPQSCVVTLTEHTDYQWLSKPEAMRKVWSETNRQAIELVVPDN